MSKLLSLVLLQFSHPYIRTKSTKHYQTAASSMHRKSKVDLVTTGRHQFLFTFTICHTSEEKIVISTSSPSFGLAQPTPCKCLHSFPPYVRPQAHTGGSPPVLLCTAALLLSTDLTRAPEPSGSIPSMSCTFLRHKCPFSSKECPSLSLKEMQQALTIFCPFGALLSVCILQQVEYQTNASCNSRAVLSASPSPSPPPYLTLPPKCGLCSPY